MADVASITTTAVNTDWWANAAVVAAGVLTALVASLAGVVTYLQQKKAARRDERARMYATAIQAVEDYLECPYRIQRRDDSDATRTALTNRISDIQSAIAYHQALMQIHGDRGVAQAYDEFVAAARSEAGAAMAHAWECPPLRQAPGMPTAAQFARTASDNARTTLLLRMHADLNA